MQLVGSGAVMPEIVDAAAMLADEGIAAHVIDVTAPDRLLGAWRESIRGSIADALAYPLPRSLSGLLCGGEPMVTVHDASPHSLAWLGATVGARTIALGIDTFGQSGSIDALYGVHQLTAGSIVNAALLALSDTAPVA